MSFFGLGEDVHLDRNSIEDDGGGASSMMEGIIGNDFPEEPENFHYSGIYVPLMIYWTETFGQHVTFCMVLLTALKLRGCLSDSPPESSLYKHQSMDTFIHDMLYNQPLGNLESEIDANAGNTSGRLLHYSIADSGIQSSVSLQDQLHLSLVS